MPSVDFLSSKGWLSVFRHTTICALLVVAVLLTLTAMVVRYFNGLHETHEQSAAQYWAEAFITRLTGRLDANLAIGYGIDAHLSVTGNITQPELESLGERLQQGQLNVRHIAVAPDLVVQQIHPLLGNESILGLDYRQHREQGADVIKAFESQSIILSGPVHLIQDGEFELIARLPVSTQNNISWGIVSVVIDLDTLLKDAKLDELREQYDVALQSNNPVSTPDIVGMPDLFDQDAQIHTIAIPGGQWRMAIKPRSGWQLPHSLLLAYWAVGVVISLLAGLLVFYFGNAIGHKRRHIQHLESIAAVDSLTKLSSRHQLNNDLDALVGEYSRDKREFAVLFVDLDHFKDINDSRGHKVGDQILFEVGQRLRRSVRSYDLVGRLSGDEFIVVLKDTHSVSDLEGRVQRIRETVYGDLELDGYTFNIGCSVGIALFPHDGADGDSLIQHADLAMYQSKRNGRNGHYFFNMVLRQEVDRYIDLVSSMRSSLNQHQFEVYFQPIYDIRTREFSHCEALCRWFKPGEGFVSPADFIPAAEQSGLICDLGQWIVESSLAMCQSLQANGIEMNISINRSLKEFNSVKHVDHLTQLVQQSGIASNQITLEITESLFMEDNKQNITNFKKLEKNGFKFSIDDFGTGYSSINYLRKYPVDHLKIDKSFISGIGESGPSDALVSTIIQMAQNLGMSVIAEGVENEAQFEFLAENGCDYIQGFYFAKPMPREDFMAFILQHRRSQGVG